MPRDYLKNQSSTEGVFIPRWVLIVIGILVAVLLSYSFLRVPSWTLQRLDSPQGTHAALLKRSNDFDHYYLLFLKKGQGWERIWKSGAIPIEYTQDRGERLQWLDEDTLVLRENDTILVAIDARTKRVLSLENLTLPVEASLKTEPHTSR